MSKKKPRAINISPEVEPQPQKENLQTFLLICLLLAICALVPYIQTLSHDFVALDDVDYVLGNHFVKMGLNSTSIHWAFTTFHAQNWHPLTWISLMIDASIGGLNPRGFHLTNIIFHLLNTLLMFLVFSRMTKNIWRSAFVAALFAVHPLHVESVAWIAERKDTLSIFFWLLTMYAYVLYAERPSIRRYLPVLGAYALGLMAKPMLVTLPLILLLMDFWPLKRLTGKNHSKLVLEKTPLFALAMASCVVTFLAQRTGAVATLEQWSPSVRVSNALISYVSYIGKMLLPINLSVFYPTTGMETWQVIGAVLLLASITTLAISSARKRPYVTMGWLWYVITLIPVIGFIQVGRQAMADRYTYITLTGLFVIAAWGIPDMLKKTSGRVLAVPAAIVIILFMGISCKQAGYWKDTYTLFNRAVEVTPDNYLAYGTLGSQYRLDGKYEEAINNCTKAVEIRPDYGPALKNLAFSLSAVKDYAQAIPYYTSALEQTQNDQELMLALGDAYANSKQYAQAIEVYAKVQKIAPRSFGLHNNLGNLYWEMGNIPEAIKEFNTALDIYPNSAETHMNLGSLLGQNNRIDEAIYHLREAVRLAPNSPDPHGNLAIALFLKGDPAGSYEEIELCQKHGGTPDPTIVAQVTAALKR